MCVYVCERAAKDQIEYTVAFKNILIAHLL